MRFVLKASPPNVLIGGSVSNPPVVSPVEPPIEAFGNDGLLLGFLLHRKLWRIRPSGLLKNTECFEGLSMSGIYLMISKSLSVRPEPVEGLRERFSARD